MPDLDERLDLAERTLTALVADAELPPKIGVHPRPAGSFAHAMPALPARRRPGRRGRPARHEMGRRSSPTNNARGLPAINAVVVLNDAATGLPRRSSTAGRSPRCGPRRSAAWPSAGSPRGVEGRAAPRRADRRRDPGPQPSRRSSGACCPGVELTVFDRHPDRAERPWPRRPAATAGIGAAAVAPESRAAVARCGRRRDRRLVRSRPPGDDADWLADDALVVPVDYATYCAAEVARDAALFLVDDRDQFLANRDAGAVRRLPGPDGDARRGDPRRHAAARVADGSWRPTSASGWRTWCSGHAIVRRAEALGLGTLLAR